MNGRLYDPLLGRFLSPDNNVQMPDISQNFNRYSYALNNPLVFTDPDGEILIPMLIGAGIATLTNGLTNVNHGQKFFNNAGKAALFGAIGGAASFGIGQAATALGNTGWSSLAVSGFQAGSHAASGGILAAAQGGNFWDGFAAGGVASGLSSGANILNLGTDGQIIAGGIGGGIGATIAGGDFFYGMGQGFITGGLNHAIHSGTFGTGLAMASITGQTRHLFGPDATSISASANGSSAVNVGTEGGALIVLRGKEKGIYSIFDISAGVGGVDVSLAAEYTNLYYSGKIRDLTASKFYGTRWEANVSVGAIISAGVNISYARLPQREFVIGFGGSVGIGASATIAAANINTGVSASSVKHAQILIRNALGINR